MIKILFVCLGNICRSPMAEAVLGKMVKDTGLSGNVEIDSAGTADYHVGEVADPRTRATLAKHGIEYGGSGRQLSREDFYTFDYILAMDKENLRDILAVKPKDAKAEVKLFLEFAEGVDTDEVPDPWYDGNFERVYELVEVGCEGVMRVIRAKL